MGDILVKRKGKIFGILKEIDLCEIFICDNS